MIQTQALLAGTVVNADDLFKRNKKIDGDAEFVWQLADDLVKGTKAMRERKEEYLPLDPQEEYDRYRSRLNRSFLFPAYDQTLTELARKPFCIPVKMLDEASGEEIDDGRLDPFLRNVDREGTMLQTFFQRWFQAAIHHGAAYVIVDAPSDGGLPYFALIYGSDVIDWRLSADGSGVDILLYRSGTNVVQYQTDQVINFAPLVPDDPKPTEYTVESIVPNPLGLIEFVDIRTRRITGLFARPALEDLAWINLEHYQGASDHRALLRFARFSLLHLAGYDKDSVKKNVMWQGLSCILYNTKPEAKAEYVKIDPALIEKSQLDLQQIERRMEALGTRPMERGEARATATEKLIVDVRENSDLLCWIAFAQDAFARALMFAFARLGMRQTIKVELFRDFGVGATSVEHGKLLLQAAEQGVISKETTIGEMRRRNIVSENIVADEELDRVEREEPEPMALAPMLPTQPPMDSMIKKPT